MKKFLIYGMILIVLSAAGCKSGRSGSQGNTGTDSKNEVAVYLTEQEFKDKVFNFDQNKEWKYEGTKPAVIDFYADWCAPCRQLSPILESVVKEYNGQVILYKIDTEKERDLTEKLGVQALPTLLYIPAEGRPQVRMGLMPKDSLRQTINKILLKK